MNVQEAWDNSGKTVDYMTQYYAANSFEAFKVRSTDQAGSAVCRNFVSARYPASGDFFDALIEPDVPVQYHAWFHEIPFTSASVPPISQYKVFYHIYAGKDSGAYYSVYLTSPSGSSYYQDIQTVSVASGYIAKGDYASETKDFTATAGYQELCINVNGQEECGFDRVTSSFALDYVEDQVMKDQLENKDIKTEKECISGSPSLYGFATPNIQEGAADAIDPEIYKRGIVRVCATDNPGKGTDNTRWIEVGYCGDEKTKCWLDKTSIDTVIKFNATKDELKDFTDDALKKMIEQEGYFTDQGFNDEIKRINEMTTSQDKINAITQTIIDKAFYNLQKATLLFLRGIVYGELAEGEYEKVKKAEQQAGTTTTTTLEEGGGVSETSTTSEGEKKEEQTTQEKTQTTAEDGTKEFVLNLGEEKKIERYTLRLSGVRKPLLGDKMALIKIKSDSEEEKDYSIVEGGSISLESGKITIKLLSVD